MTKHNYMHHRDLENAGLSEIEAKIYLAALELGETTVSRISQKSKVKRTTVYLYIDLLKQKGLISTAKRGKKVTFIAENPRKLAEGLEEKKNRLNKIMPELLTYVKLFDKKPEIRFYEGKEGISDVYRDTLRYPGQEILMWCSEDYATHFDEKFLLDFYVPERKNKKISLRVLWPDKPRFRELAKDDVTHLRKSKLLPANVFKIGIELCVYGNNKINIISYEEQFAVIIESQVIHDSLKSIFETMWISTLSTT